MKSLSEVYENISARDQEILEKQAAEKLAALEEEAAGRIMARGFMDELNKLAQDAFGGTTPAAPKAPKMQTIKSNPGSAGSMNPKSTGAGMSLGGRSASAPPTPAQPKSVTLGAGGMATGGGKQVDVLKGTGGK